MAKKEKTVLTPEELQAQKERKTEKRKLFGETFVKALALMLSIVLVYSIVYIAFGQGTTIQKTVVVQGSTSTSKSGSGSSGSGNSGSGSSSDTGTGTGTGSGASSDSGSGSSGTGDSSQAETVASAINAATAKVVNEKAGYKLARNCYYTTPVDVGSATSILNGVIQGVDENADLDSVVGGFLGVGDKSYDIPKGADAAETIDYHGTNYAIKATSLKASDLQGLSVNGDTYTFTLEDVDTPAKDESSSFSRFTNDIIIQSEVDSEIQEYVSVVSVNSLKAVYTNIQVTATITDGQLTSLKYSYDGDAELGLKVGVTITGTGAIHTDAVYSDFVY